MLDDGRKVYTENNFEGPYLVDGSGAKYDMEIEQWKVVEDGPVCVVLAANGSNKIQGKTVGFELRVTAYAKKSWIEVGYRIINTDYSPLQIKSLVFHLKAGEGAVSDELGGMSFEEETDSTGCGDMQTDNSNNEGPLFHTRGTTELEGIEKKAPVDKVSVLRFIRRSRIILRQYAPIRME